MQISVNKLQARRPRIFQKGSDRFFFPSPFFSLCLLLPPLLNTNETRAGIQSPRFLMAFCICVLSLWPEKIMRERGMKTGEKETDKKMGPGENGECVCVPVWTHVLSLVLGRAVDRKSTRLNSSHRSLARMLSSA